MPRFASSSPRGWQVALLAFALVVLWLNATGAHAQTPAEQAKADACEAWLRAHLQLKEVGANNRAPLIDTWARRAGVGLGSEWCGLTQMECQLENGLPIPAGPAGSYNWFLKTSPRTVYLQGQRGTYANMVRGYPAGLFNRRLGRVAHITRIVQVVWNGPHTRPPRGFWCIAGNEGNFPGGVHLTFYPYSSLYAASDWLH